VPGGVSFPEGVRPTHLLELPHAMKMHVAHVCEGGVDFAVAAVRPTLMSGLKRERDAAIEALTAELGVPAVLMMERPCGSPTYYGDPDLVCLLAGLCSEQLSWCELTTQAA
jgi:hypothetical protein